MTDWVRLWHDMPTDPKWRVIARKAGQRIGDVIAVFNFVMVNASANANERGRTHNLFAEDIGAALDMGEADVQAILDAMKGKVICPDGSLLGWEKRQPKREDNSAARAKAWREERKRTQTNANERPETDTEVIPLSNDNGGDLSKSLFDQGVRLLTSKGRTETQARSFLAKCQKDYGDGPTLAAIQRCRNATDPLSAMRSALGRSKSQSEYYGV